MRIKIPLQIIKLESDNYHIIISGTFADGTTGNWVVDTGASKTVFDKTRVNFYSVLAGEADEIHTAGTGEEPQEISLALLNPFQIGKLKITNQKVALLDLSNINQLYTKATQLTICGLIGGDFLFEHSAIIDYKKQVLLLNK